MTDLRHAIGLIKADRKAEARKLLIRLVKTEPDNAQAWFALAACVANRQELQVCIHNLLRINPQDSRAHQLASHYSIEPQAPDRPPVQAPEENAAGAVDPEPTRQSQPTELMRPVDRRHLAEILDQPLPPRKRRKSKKDALQAETPEDPSEYRRLPRWIWLLVSVAVLIIVALIATVWWADEQQSRDIQNMETAEGLNTQRAVIVATNRALETTAYSRATAYVATEAVYITPSPPQPKDLFTVRLVAVTAAGDVTAVGREQFRPGQDIGIWIEAQAPVAIDLVLRLVWLGDETPQIVLSDEIVLALDMAGAVETVALAAPDGGWQPGNYQVRLLAGEALIQELALSVAP
ncbi:MAG: hypothetical protein GYB66_03570 [Chloroflexi bacterium]|nr:hypothetical protein [Chloroflexota bacterium]